MIEKITAHLKSPRSIVCLGTLGLFLILPLISQALDTSYYNKLAIRIMIYALAAVSLNLILGYGGMVSFGHAMFILIGAYAVTIPTSHGISNGVIHLGIAVFCAAGIALITGYICLRTTGMAFIMITLAFAQMLFFLAVSLKQYGGDDGLTLPARSSFGFFDLSNNLVLYYFTFALLFAAIAAMFKLVRSPFGMTLRGIKQNERRMNALGHAPLKYQLTAYVVSACVAAVAGFLLANLTNFASPAYGAWTVSGELIVIIILGGVGTVYGPVLGAAAFLLLEELLPHLVEMVAPNYKSNWMLILGLLIVVMTLTLKRGIYGSLPGDDE
jgi:branched-chain amino acid transport system permease protein